MSLQKAKQGLLLLGWLCVPRTSWDQAGFHLARGLHDASVMGLFTIKKLLILIKRLIND